MRLLIHDYAGHPFQVQLSRELARRGHSVTHAYAGGLLTPRGNLQKSPTDPASLDIIEVPMDPNYRRDKYRFFRRWRMEVKYGRDIASLIARIKPQIVLSANTPSDPQWRIALACRAEGAAFIPWIQDFYGLAVSKLARQKNPALGRLAGRWYRRLDARALSFASAVIAITPDFIPFLQKAGVPSEKISVIPNWAPLDDLPAKPRRNPWSFAHGLDNKFVFLYAGTLAMKHNPGLLLALANSFRDNPQIRIVVVSEGPGADFLNKRKSVEHLDNLVLLPFQDFSRLPETLASADVLLAILEAEAGIFSAPSKVLTCLCAARPILAAIPAQNFSARAIAEARSGTCVEPSDSEGFLRAARQYHADSQLCQQQGAAGRSYAETNFDINKIADRFESILRKSAV